MADIIKLRRDTAANWAAANPVLNDGEAGWDKTNDLLKIGDGVTAWSSLSGVSTDILGDDNTWTGINTYPGQPSFLVYRSTADGDQVNLVDGVVTAVILPSEIFDQGGDVDSNGVFTAPVTGRYFFVAGLTYVNLNASVTSGNMRITTSNRTYIGALSNPWPIADLNNKVTQTLSVIADMDLGDTANMGGQIKGVSTVDIEGNDNLQTYFSGQLLA